jgi:hypothetical protein
MTLFRETEKTIQKFIRKPKRTQMPKAILSTTEQCRGFKTCDFKLYYKGKTPSSTNGAVKLDIHI